MQDLPRLLFNPSTVSNWYPVSLLITTSSSLSLVYFSCSLWSALKLIPPPSLSGINSSLSHLQKGSVTVFLFHPSLTASVKRVFLTEMAVLPVMAFCCVVEALEATCQFKNKICFLTINTVFLTQPTVGLFSWLFSQVLFRQCALVCVSLV